MNYTEKFHLPQWETKDRVLMDDFNLAMAGIEAGLSGAASGTSLLDEKTCEMLRRAAYNHYHLSAAGAFPRQMGAFHQSMASALPENALGFFHRGDCAWIANGPAASIDDLKAAITQTSPLVVYMSNLSACQKMVLSFTAPGHMYVDFIQLTAPMTTGNTSSKGRIRCTLRDLSANVDANVTEYDIGLIPNVVGTGIINIYLNAYLRSGCKYRLEVEPLEVGYEATFDFYNHFAKIQGSPCASQNGSLSYTLSDSEICQMGLVFVRYAADGNDQFFSLNWNGTAWPVNKVRRGVWPDGRTYKEAEFLRIGDIPTENQLLLSADCGTKGEFSIYEWGAILI